MHADGRHVIAWEEWQRMSTGGRLAFAWTGIRLLLDDVRRRGAGGGALACALAPLGAAWAAGQLAIVLGVGYPDPDLSHFRSIDIWETGSGSGQVLTEGWLASALREAPEPAARFADGVVIGTPEMW